jgi:unsaturated chondroitin disaccharide hydrolase
MDKKLTEKFEAARCFAENQLRNLITHYPGYFPIYTTMGRWHHEGASWTNWCEGFLGGQLWLTYEYNRDPWWRKQAINYCQLIEPRQFDRSVHDLGFLFMPTWKKWYELEPDRQTQQVVLTAGRTLAERFIKKGQYLHSFIARNSLFIDIMMNVGIIFYTAQVTGDANLWRIANQHCQTTRRTLLRGDGSTAHEGIFNLETGQFLHQSTQQGWRSDSCWARGQAWAIYGFTSAYSYTKDNRFLQSAEACASYFLSQTTEQVIPPNDWNDPEPALPFESSAAAIAASGLLDLAKATGDPTRSILYTKTALTILDSLSSPQFLASQTTDWEGILRHAIYHQKKGLGVDESVMWGDYFYLEAIRKVLTDGN